MKITRVVGVAGGNAPAKAPGCMIEKGFVPDREILQRESGGLCFGERQREDGVTEPVLRQIGWELKEREIIRFVIGGKAKIVKKRTVDGERTFVENAKDTCIGRAYEGKLCFGIGSHERILGLGQHEEGISSYRNCTLHLYQNNMQIPMPVFLSSAGYAVLVDADCLMIYEERDNRITFTLDAVEQIAYYVIEGGSMGELVKGLRVLTGKAPLLPRWAYGYVQSREKYRSQKELLDTAEEFEKRNIPVSCLVQDWMTWSAGKWGDKHLDKERYPDLKAAVEELHKKGIGFMFSVWPNINSGSVDNQEMLDAGKLYANLSTYDAFDEEARELYWKQCEREIFAAGTDAWWCDSTEPFTPDWGGSEKKSNEERYELAKGSLTKYMDARQANAFALYHARGIHDNQRKCDESRRVVNLTRSGWPSIQKYGAILWSGDIMATWEVFRRQIAEGLQMCASGIPYWTLDIGGFFAGNYNAWKRWSNAKEGTQPWFWNGAFEEGVGDRGYCELYTRWLQYGAFLPVMRSHGTDTPREPWNFGEPGSIYYDTITKYIRLRYHLVPYIYSLAYRVYREDELFMRPLIFDYPEDERAVTAEDQFLFGDFLVCPVTEAMEYGPGSTPLNKKKIRRVYLPEGECWYDYETGECFRGGREIMAASPIEKMPLYIRGGSIVPVNPRDKADLYHERTPEKLTVEIFSGRDGAFLYYDDSGNSYAYRKGQYTAVSLSWNEKERKLVLSDAEGSCAYPKTWEIRLTDRTGRHTVREFSYAGKEMTVELSD